MVISAAETERVKRAVLKNLMFKDSEPEMIILKYTLEYISVNGQMACPLADVSFTATTAGYFHSNGIKMPTP